MMVPYQVDRACGIANTENGNTQRKKKTEHTPKGKKEKKTISLTTRKKRNEISRRLWRDVSPSPEVVRVVPPKSYSWSSPYSSSSSPKRTTISSPLSASSISPSFARQASRARLTFSSSTPCPMKTISFVALHSLAGRRPRRARRRVAPGEGLEEAAQAGAAGPC